MTRKITVSTLYRHPIKSLMAETVKTLNLTADGRIEGDRVFAFKNKKQHDGEKMRWRSKHNYLSLVNTPALGGLGAKFEITDGTLSLIKKDAVLASGSKFKAVESIQPNTTGKQLSFSVLANES